jgi:hypothetical protein
MFEAPIRKQCPVCGSHAGERCIDGEGHLMEHFHVPRLASRSVAERTADGRTVDSSQET